MNYELEALMGGTMTSKGRELTDTMQKRRIEALCVQEKRWKSSSVREMGEGHKLYYS